MTVVGVVAVVLVLGGLAVVETNTGPFEHEVTAVEHATTLEGTLLVEEGSASELCASPAGDQACQPRSELDLTLEGWPRLEGPMAYRAVLVDGDARVDLGVLAHEAGEHRLRFDGDVDAEAYQTLHVGLARAGASGGVAFALLEVPVPDSGGEPVPVEATADTRLAPVQGDLRVAQIGAVEVAVTTSARIEGLPAREGWSYRAWLVDDEGPAFTPLGEVSEPDGAGLVDARSERVHLVDQDRFLVTLEPADSAAGPAASGFPVAGASIEASSLSTRWGR